MATKDTKPPAGPSAEDLLGDGGSVEGIGQDEGLGDNEGLDPNHPVLSLAEQCAARDEAREIIAEERRKAAFADLVAQERQKILGKEGLRTGDPVKDEMVSITLDLAEHSDRIVLNGTIYLHGHTFKVPRHVADTLRDIQTRGHNHQNEIDGKSIADRFRRPHNTIVETRQGNRNYGAALNAPAPIA